MPGSRPDRRSRPRVGHARRHAGFTLVELVVVIVVVGVLSAIAVPRFIALGRDARIASLKALAGTVQSTAINVHAACALNPTCDYGAGSQMLTIGGRAAWLNFGWLDSGDRLNVDQIDVWVIHDGFTASLADWMTTGQPRRRAESSQLLCQLPADLDADLRALHDDRHQRLLSAACPRSSAASNPSAFRPAPTTRAASRSAGSAMRPAGGRAKGRR